MCSGGAERVASLWANGFLQRGYNVTIVTNLSKDVVYDLDENVRLFDLYKYGYVFEKKHIINDLKRIRKIIKEISPDVIITVLYPVDLFVLFASINLSIPIINTQHNSFDRPKGAEIPLLDRFVRFFLNKFFSQVTVLTEADRLYIGERLDNLTVLPNPLSFAPVEKIPLKEKWILASGRLDAWHCKGFDTLLKAWGLIAKKNPGWKLKICGSGKTESLEFLMNIAKDNFVDSQTEFVGFCKNIVDYYKKSAIFVLSSRYEGFGMVLIEAMSQGCACVACDYKGRQREIITNDSQGVICLPEDISAMSKALQRLIDDEKDRNIMQKNAIERSKFYDLSNIMDRWDDIFKKVGLKK